MSELYSSSVFSQAASDFLSIENQYRLDHHGTDLMDIVKAAGIPHEYSIEHKSTEIIFQQDGITITAFALDHEPIEPAVGTENVGRC